MTLKTLKRDIYCNQNLQHRSIVVSKHNLKLLLIVCCLFIEKFTYSVKLRN